MLWTKLCLEWTGYGNIGFGTGAIFIDRKTIPLVKGNGTPGCRRVVGSEDMMIEARSQCDVPSKTLYRSLGVMTPAWMTETVELSPGVRVARVLLNDAGGECQVQIVNLGERSVRLNKNQDIGELHPVQVNEEVTMSLKLQDKNEELMSKTLMEYMSVEVPCEAKEQLRELSIDHDDGLENTTVSERKNSKCILENHGQ